MSSFDKFSYATSPGHAQGRPACKLPAKSLRKENLRAAASPLKERGHVVALNSLDELRDEFAHFNVKSWSIERAHILKCLGFALEYVRHYTCLTPAILWHDAALQQRAQAAIAALGCLLRRV